MCWCQFDNTQVGLGNVNTCTMLLFCKRQQTLRTEQHQVKGKPGERGKFWGQFSQHTLQWVIWGFSTDNTKKTCCTTTGSNPGLRPESHRICSYSAILYLYHVTRFFNLVFHEFIFCQRATPWVFQHLIFSWKYLWQTMLWLFNGIFATFYYDNMTPLWNQTDFYTFTVI